MAFGRHRFSIATVAMVGFLSQLCSSEPNSLVITMICRDEEVNFKSNLALWLPVADYFVFMMDMRTKDRSRETIAEILSGNAPYEVVAYEFDGFGTARTASLDAAWKHFPQATHVLIADPDWRPDTSTMNKVELDLQHDVFRFMVYDRNGETTRRMDWLLRHREGLRMRYSLHEVLDIGLYSLKYISWVAHEIEKPGTWHTSVGHGNSMSAMRYQFDLTMLEKDLIKYPHDPHVHYYLGLTHQAYAEGLVQSQNSSVAVDYVDGHLDKSIYYLKLRVFSEYEDDFIEQRWSSMMLLGSVYTNYKKDFTNAELWFSLCRDYNMKQCECSMALARLYVAHGSLDMAFNEMEKILRTQREDRLMLNWFKTWECDVPQLAVTLFSHYLRIYAALATPQDAMYLLLLRYLLDNPKCGLPAKDRMLSAETRADVEALLAKVPAAQGGGRGLLRADVSLNDLCAHDLLQQHILVKKYRVHPCAAVAEAAAYAGECGDFHYLMPPPIEEYQARDKQQFLGSASLVDIVHHVYAGDSRRLKPAGRKYRVLFAEHFNPRNLYSLLGQSLAPYASQVEIVAVVSPMTAEEARWREEGALSPRERILAKVDQCFPPLSGGRPPALTVIEMSLSDYFSKLMSSMASAKNKNVYIPNEYLFDFIEYNGGLSSSPLYREHLRMMNEFLVPDGAVGATYFTQNVHQETIGRLVAASDPEALVPFSLQPKRTAKAYLQASKQLSLLADDDELVGFLAGDMDDYLNIRAKHGKRHRTEFFTRDGQTGKAFQRADVEAALGAAGLGVKSWVPSAFSHPFEELDHYSVQKYRSMGMTEDNFLFHLFPSFRLTVYAVRIQAEPAPPGRAKVGPWLVPFPPNDPRGLAAASSGPPQRDFSTSTGDFVVLDRLGPRTLSTTFANSARSAASRISTSFAFSHYSAVEGINFTHIALPTISACMDALSTKPTIARLMQINRDLHATAGYSYDEDYATHLLLQLLRFFESINVISLWYVDKADATPQRIEESFTLPIRVVKPDATRKMGLTASGGSARQAGVGTTSMGGISSGSGSGSSSSSSGGSSANAGGASAVGERKNTIKVGPIAYERGGPSPDTIKVGGLNVQRKTSSQKEPQAHVEVQAPRTADVSATGEARVDPSGTNSASNSDSDSDSDSASYDGGLFGNDPDDPEEEYSMDTPEGVERFYAEQEDAMRRQGFTEQKIAEAISADRVRREKRKQYQHIFDAARARNAQNAPPKPKAKRAPPTQAPLEVESGALGFEMDPRFTAELAAKRVRMERMGFPEYMVNQALKSEQNKLIRAAAKAAAAGPVKEKPPLPVPDQIDALQATIVDKRARMVRMGFPEELILQALEDDEGKLKQLKASIGRA